MKRYMNSKWLLIISTILMSIVASLMFVFWNYANKKDQFNPQLIDYESFSILLIDRHSDTIFFIDENGNSSQLFNMFIIYPDSNEFASLNSEKAVTWDVSGNKMAFLQARYTTREGMPIIYSLPEQRFFKCSQAPLGADRIWIIEDLVIITTEYRKNDSDRLLLFDFETCEIKQILYEASSNEEILAEGTINSNTNLIALEKTNKNNKNIIVFELGENKILEQFQGLNPAWNSDGRRLLYVNDSGIYYYDHLSDTHNLVYESPNAKYFYPSWSPNGDFVIFNEPPNKVLQINVLTKEIVVIVESDYINPSWRNPH